MTGRSLSFVVDTGGERLDRFLADRIDDFSRESLQRLIREGGVRVNGASAKAARRLLSGDAVAIELPAASGPALRGESIAVSVIYEDSAVIVVDKPAGMVVHPGHGATSGTLVHALLGRFPELAAFEDSLRPGIVHRLDKGTSGVMVVAKTRAAQQDLAAQFAARTVTKRYLALVHGQLESERGMIEAGIGRHRSAPEQMQVAGRAARAARTAYHVVRRFPSYSLVEARPVTGRTHQIRLHFAALGHPIAGDRTYGKRTPPSGLHRQFLHARSLTFNLPGGGGPREFHAGLPPDLQTVLDRLSENTS